jgi:hypothetical protein
LEGNKRQKQAIKKARFLYGNPASEEGDEIIESKLFSFFLDHKILYPKFLTIGIIPIFAGIYAYF